MDLHKRKPRMMMNKLSNVLLLGVALCICTGINAQRKKRGKDKNEAYELATELDSLSYSLGVSVSSNLLSQDIDTLSAGALIQAIKDNLVDKNTKISENDARNIVTEYFKKLQEQQELQVKQAGKEFLEKNAKREGVVSLPSGLQYEIIKEGTGDKTPEITDRVKVHYHGTLIDGTVFDSSVQRGSPAQFPVNGVIRGWVEALQLMKPGAKWKLYIPYDLAYRDRSAGKIPAFSTLIFEVELLEILE
ncbi:MAG: FKBP-type peptidyl-prolyl cis-trans isomerase [Luteibaculum sp.]